MQKKKRLLAFALCALLLCALLPPRAAAAPTLYFTAVNDRMCDLSDATMPFWQNGTLYIAGATVDDRENLGIQYSYNPEKSVALLIRRQEVLYCDLAAGTMENNRTGERYAGSPIVRGGMVFFPISALTRMFDLKYSSTKITYGYLVRIRDDSAVLSDEYFIDAATDPIQRRYAQYERTHAPETPEPETPETPETPAQRDGLTVYLLLPVTDEDEGMRLLNALDADGVRATLLLTPETMETADDLLRRAAATGHAIAVSAEAETADEALAQIGRANDRLWSAASLRTRLVYLADGSRELRAAVSDAGFCPLTVNVSDFTRSGSHWAETALGRSGQSSSVRLYLGANADLSLFLPSALDRLLAGKCTVSALNELSA